MGLARSYLLESENGLALIDAGSPRSEEAVLRLMQALDRNDLRLIFITHAHLDHYGSAAVLRRLTGAPIAIHCADASAIARGETSLGSTRGRGRFLGPIIPLLEPLLRPEPAQADILLQDGESLPIPGLKTTVIHTPGHTPGSCCLLVDGRFAFAGDLISASGYPHVQRYFAHDWSLIPSSLARLQALKPQSVFPGHGRYPIDGETLQTLSTDYRVLCA